MTFLHTISDVHVEGKTIVIVRLTFFSLKSERQAETKSLQPVVSTANIGQLAVDLLITNLSLEKIGDFDPKYFVPVVGAREDGRYGITTPMERERFHRARSQVKDTK